MKKFKLPKEFAERWLAALRSGKFKQGRNTLYSRTKGGYCCLGVAEIVGGNTTRKLKNCGIPKDLEKKSKVPEELKGEMRPGELVGELINLNDSKSYSFPQIADWVEENVEFY